ncbi:MULTISPECIES: sensor histidine kinase [unclassified Streptomyces]|uniref:sensor histidine kinase n=1 Tax=unclassified Streptomyces TaxID=2593676 RepID=UPI0036572441
MSATSLFPQLRPLDRIWRPVAAWCGGVAYPFALLLAVRSGPDNSTSLRFLLCAVATVLPVALLRRHPLPATALMLAGTFAVSAQRPSWEVVYLLVLANDLAVLSVVASRTRRVALAAAVPTLLVHIASATYFTSGSDVYIRTLVVLALALVAAWMIGVSIRERREHAVEQRTQVAAQAVAAERLRIARELHDMIAHSIGVIAIQAGVGSRVIGTQPDEARKALVSIEATSRETLAGLRRTLGTLRRTGPDAGAEPVSLDPTPGLADIGRLAASTSKGAGVGVELRWRGARREIPADIDLSAYRIVQEAVTNVVRHAGTRSCRVTVGYGAGEVSVEVVDDGRGCEPADIDRSGGWGLVGMRERVGLLGGRLTAGPRPEGGFRVEARLPVPVPAPTSGTEAGARTDVVR